jgi:Ni,Fe-hydrogenase I small subunit
MAITRRQFVTRLGALAAAVGFSQAEVSKLAEAFAGNSNPAYGNGTFGKPKVIWIHGAECTGCSTSLLSILEDADGRPFRYDSNPALTGITTGAALGLAGVTNYAGGAFPTLAGATRDALYGGPEHVNIADVVIDVVDLQYHETVMGMGGDLAAKWLQDFRANYAANQTAPFVLVVEGALQDKRYGGAWNDQSDIHVPWCSVGVADDGTLEQDMPEVVAELAVMAECAAIISIGQCATYGGYPGCKPQITSANAGFNATMSQTGAKGTFDFLDQYVDTDNEAFADLVNAAAAKVINVPGCPTNPWWFVLSVVMVMLKLAGTDLIELDAGRRIKKVYPGTVHSAFCPRYPSYAKGIYALKPGDPGCLQKLGCKGISARSLCGKHGWNNQQPENDGTLSTLNKNGVGGHCTVSGYPCMACTEKGYPDSFVPFVKR